jgi:glutamate carboxypeptidase
MQLSKGQRACLLAVAAALLAVGLAPWPQSGAPQSEAAQPSGKCPAGFTSSHGAASLPAGHPPVSARAPAPPAALYFDPVPALEEPSGALACRGSRCVALTLSARAEAEVGLLAWLQSHASAAEALLEALVNIDSATSNKAGVDAVADALEAHLRSAGVEVERRRQLAVGDHLLARVRCGAEDETAQAVRVLLMGHMDTVWADGTAAQRPYSRSPDGTRAFGPGVSDMKVGLVSAALILEAMQSNGCAGAGPMVLEALFTSDEEVGSVVSRHAIREAATGATAVMNMESGSGEGAIAAARKGSLTLSFEVAGKAAHAGNAPHEGASAVEAFSRKVLRMHALNKYTVGVPGVKGVDGITVSVGTVAGGEAPNVIPDRVAATVNARAWTQAELAMLNATLRSIIADADVAGTSGRVTAEATFPPFEQTAASAGLLTLFRRVAATLGGEQVSADRRGGAADSAFASATGAPTLCAVGPLGDDAHAVTEYLLLDSIVPRTQLVALTCLRIARAGGLTL